MPLDYRAGKPGVFRIYGVRKQRRESTDAERKLWSVLRDRQLAGAKFRRQHQFGPYTFDFYCAGYKLAIEADGGQHHEPEGLEHDQARTAFLNSNGIRVLRFDDNEILTNVEGVSARILEAIEDDQPSPVLGAPRRRPASPRGRGATATAPTTINPQENQ